MRKPPMCLSYAIWAMGALWHPKYDRCADVFYRRARYYAEADEMRVRSQRYRLVSGSISHQLTTSHSRNVENISLR